MLRGHLDNIDAASTVEGTSKMRGARICCADDALVGLEHWNPQIPEPGALRYQVGL